MRDLKVAIAVVAIALWVFYFAPLWIEWFQQIPNIRLARE